MTLYVEIDPSSLKRAEEALEREIAAQSSIVSIRRQSKAEWDAAQARARFWREFDQRQTTQVRTA